MRIRHNSVLCFTVLAVALLVCPLHAAETRIALVIGNNAYNGLERLKNSVNDARLMARTLRGLGFEVVERTDVDENTMKRAIQEFGRRIMQAGRNPVSLFYYAGHGLQVNGNNYLVPINARLERTSDVEIEAVDVALVLHQMKDASSRVNIVILDACRNNPLSRGLRSMTRGLASIDAPKGSLIAFSTAPNDVSVDGEGENSPYTLALAKAMQVPGLTTAEVFEQVRRQVLAATGDRQLTWEHSSLIGAFYFSTSSAVAGVGTHTPSQGVGVPVAVPETKPPEQPSVTRAEGLSTTPRPVMSSDIAGRWEGRYQCQREEIGFFLDVTNGDGNRITAVFESFPLPGMLSFPRGSFSMSGDYNRTDGSLRLQRTGWIKRPLGVESHDLEGQLAVNGTTISGRVLTTGCAHFVLTRR
jgi:hypothetical protein